MSAAAAPHPIFLSGVAAFALRTTPLQSDAQGMTNAVYVSLSVRNKMVDLMAEKWVDGLGPLAYVGDAVFAVALWEHEDALAIGLSASQRAAAGVAVADPVLVTPMTSKNDWRVTRASKVVMAVRVLHGREDAADKPITRQATAEAIHTRLDTHVLKVGQQFTLPVGGKVLLCTVKSAYTERPSNATERSIMQLSDIRGFMQLYPSTCIELMTESVFAD